jgi:ferredoxin
MIITISKPLDDILRNLNGRKKVFIAGCAACATKCQTGGVEAVNAIAAELSARGYTVTGTAILDTPCDIRIAKRDIHRSPSAQAADSILVLACGAGAQAIEAAIDKPIIPGLTPVFVGTTERIGQYQEFCSVCGDCMLEVTGGICPVTRCAKGLVNGPCGGVIDGKCETDPTRDCAWVLIFEKLKKTGTLAAWQARITPPRKTAKPKHLERNRG